MNQLIILVFLNSLVCTEIHFSLSDDADNFTATDIEDAGVDDEDEEEEE